MTSAPRVDTFCPSIGWSITSRQLLSVMPRQEGSGLCYGDSGGPLISLEPEGRATSALDLIEGESALRQESVEGRRRSAIIGVESIGSISCMGTERIQLIKDQTEWLRATLRGSTDDLDQSSLCQIGEVYCDGLRAYSCPYGRLIIQDCPTAELCAPAQDCLSA